MRQDTVPSEPF